jgi:sulfate adenylyltransferase
MGEYFIGGRVSLDHRVTMEFSKFDLTPKETRAHFAKKGWESVVGFQTRNVPHRAHEYLLRLALEQADGLFVQPLVGLKKRGDFTPAAILASYTALIDNFLPQKRVLLGILSTTMRYAGPREALLHAIVRRNYGCTHFIVGRDHAGVGNYYGKYEAQELARRYEDELGIQIMYFAGPYYCSMCDGIVTERTCPHEVTMPEATKQISGTDMRSILADNGAIANSIMRAAVVESVRDVAIFINEDSI